MTVTSAAANLDVSPKPEKGPKHIPTLDGIRAISFGIVFLAHAAASTGIGKWIPGYFGLATFFFLSGYLITTLLRIEFDRTEKIAFRDFYLRRMLRIFPPFYLILGLDCVLTLTHVLDNTLWPSAVLAQAFHLTNYWIVFHSHAPDAGWWYGLAPGSWIFWPLAVEEHFYLVFPLIYLLMRRRKMTPKQQMQALLGLCAAVLVWRCLLVFGFHVTKERTYVSSDTRVDSILFGCLLAVYGNPFLDMPTCSAERIKNFWVPLASVVLIASFGLGRIWHDFDQTLRYTVQGAALIPIFIAAVRYPGWGIFRWLNVPWVRFVGLLSYSLYLLHTTVLYAIGHHTHWHAPLVGLVSLVVSLGLATLIYHFVEKPCARLRKKLSHSGRVSGDPPSPPSPSSLVDTGVEEESRSRRVARNVLVTLATQLISWGLAFAVTLYLPRYAGDAGLGRLAFAAAFVSLFSVFVPLGTSTVLIKEIAQNRARTGELLLAAVFMRLPLGLLMTGMAIGAIALLHRASPSHFPAQTCLLVSIAALGIVVAALNDALASALQGQEKLPRQSLSALIEKFLYSGLMIGLIFARSPLWMIVAVPLVTSTVSLFVNLTAFGALWPTLRLPQWATIRHLALAGMPFFAMVVFRMIYNQVDIPLLSLMTDDRTVGWYTASARLLGSTLFIPVALATALLPSLTRLYAEAPEQFLPAVRRVIGLVMLCAVPIALPLILLPRKILLEFLHYPATFAHSAPILALYGFGVILWYLSQITGTALIVMGRQDAMCRASMIALALTLVGCLVGIPVAHHFLGNGGIGAASADVGVEIYMNLAFLAALPRGTFDRGNGLAFAKSLLAIVPMIALMCLARGIYLWVGIGAGLMIYVALCYLLGCLHKQDIETLKQALIRRPMAG